MKPNNKVILILPIFIIILLSIFYVWCQAKKDTTAAKGQLMQTISLPLPQTNSSVSIEQALVQRKSTRNYSDAPLTLQQVSQLLWAAQGITHGYEFRTAPSAGALYPLEIYLIAGKVEGLDSGVYRYLPAEHAITQVQSGDIRSVLANAALGQSPVKKAPAVIVIAAVFERTTIKYGNRGIYYVYIEAGSVSQNIYLQCVSLELGTVVIGAFIDSAVKKVVGLGNDEVPIALMPVGRIK